MSQDGFDAVGGRVLLYEVPGADNRVKCRTGNLRVPVLGLAPREDVVDITPHEMDGQAERR